jgi:hypothetical protein
MMKNKKGVEMNINTIIILVLAILVLVILGMFFSGSLKSLWEKILGQQTPWSGGSLQSAKQVCETSYSLEQFCTQKIAIRNAQNNTEEYFYCWDLGRLNANYKAVYTYSPPDGTPVKVSTEDKCRALGHDPNPPTG